MFGANQMLCAQSKHFIHIVERDVENEDTISNSPLCFQVAYDMFRLPAYTRLHVPEKFHCSVLMLLFTQIRTTHQNGVSRCIVCCT